VNGCVRFTFGCRENDAAFLGFPELEFRASAAADAMSLAATIDSVSGTSFVNSSTSLTSTRKPPRSRTNAPARPALASSPFNWTRQLIELLLISHRHGHV
jgi:hypothetical protein